MSIQTVTLTVEDQNTDPVASVAVSLNQGDYLICAGVTDEAGQVAFEFVEDGAYVVDAKLPGSVLVTTSVTVADTGIAQGFTVEVNAVGVQTFTPPETRKVFGYFTPPQPGEKPVVLVTLLETPTQVGDGSSVDPRNVMRVPSWVLSCPILSTGYWDATLRVGGLYKVEVPHSSYVRVFRFAAGGTTQNIVDIPSVPFSSSYPSLS